MTTRTNSRNEVVEPVENKMDYGITKWSERIGCQGGKSVQYQLHVLLYV
jgi:hypothetical protein